MRAQKTVGWIAVVTTLAALLTTGCSGSGEEGSASTTASTGRADRAGVAASAEVVTPEKLPPLTLSHLTQVAEAGSGESLAYDPRSGTVYLAWARPIPAEDGEPAMQAVVARSTDRGKTWSKPVVVNAPVHTQVHAHTVNPVDVEVGPNGDVYVLYAHPVAWKPPAEDVEKPSWMLPIHPFITRSEDGGQTFSKPVAVVTDSVEDLSLGTGIFRYHDLLVASDGDLFVSFLNNTAYLEAAVKKARSGDEAHTEIPVPTTRLEVTRSRDDGQTWVPTVLVAKTTCGCCGTMVAENAEGVLFAGTRGMQPLEGSYDAVRDIIVARSTDDGTTWSEPVKISDDGFKISGCPDVAPGLASDADGTLHAAWYTGTSAHPGVYYATSEDGVHWSKPLTLLRGEWVPYADVRLVIDGQGRPWVAFEDRTGEVDRLQVVMINPRTHAVAFSKAIPGHGPALAAGEDWALLSFEANLTEDDAAGPTALQSVLVSGADT
ncbi:MAG: glycoside hydrolase [Nitrococcus sp.]|nr:glycoside hydrolase [Nitrococcus sp.]